MAVNNKMHYDKLEDLPSLKKGWVRLVHRCIYKNHVNSIKENGLIFNREAAKLTPLQRGSSYPNITHMASVYDENSFWDSMHKDDFCYYDNARYADTKIVFDMPLDEFCLLETLGQRIKGKVDSKYIVGCIPNINGANKNLYLSNEEVNKAKQKSQNNPSSSVKPNNVELMIDELIANSKSNKKEQLRDMIHERMNSCKEDLEFDLSISKNKVNFSLNSINKGYTR